MHALRRPDGNAGPRAGNALDARSVLGLQSLRSSFLDDISIARRKEAVTGARAVTNDDIHHSLMAPCRVDDDDDPEDDDDLDDDDEDDDDDDDEDEDVETWQVTDRGFPLK